MAMGFLRKLRDGAKQVGKGMLKVAAPVVKAGARIAPIIGGPAGTIVGGVLDSVGKLM